MTSDTILGPVPCHNCGTKLIFVRLPSPDRFDDQRWLEALGWRVVGDGHARWLQAADEAVHHRCAAARAVA